MERNGWTVKKRKKPRVPLSNPAGFFSWDRTVLEYGLILVLLSYGCGVVLELRLRLGAAALSRSCTYGKEMELCLGVGVLSRSCSFGLELQLCQGL